MVVSLVVVVVDVVVYQRMENMTNSQGENARKERQTGK